MNRNFLEDLIEYTKRDPFLVQERCKTARIELAWMWEKYKKDPVKYYRTSDLYISDLTNYQMELQKKGFHNWFRAMVEQHGWKSMLDFGGGIGETSIIACQMGLDVTYVDVKGSQTAKYAKWRFKKYGVEPTIKDETYNIDRDFDVIEAMDVFEHLEKSQPLIEEFSKRCKHLFVNPEAVENTFNPMYPQHISKYKLEPYFEKELHDLWKSKKVATI